MVDAIERVDAVGRTDKVEMRRWNERNATTYYARPPQIPSMLMSKKTRKKLAPSELSPKIPTELSYVRVKRITSCIIAGTGNSFSGSGGQPAEIEDRERKTVAWYTS